jgi:hypothetical protein
MRNFKELESLTLDWAEEKDLLTKDNLLIQSNRVRRDVENLHDAVIAKSKGFKEYVNSRNNISNTQDMIEHSLGRMLLNLIILAEVNNVSLEEALTEAYKNKNNF